MQKMLCMAGRHPFIRPDKENLYAFLLTRQAQYPRSVKLFPFVFDSIAPCG